MLNYSSYNNWFKKYCVAFFALLALTLVLAGCNQVSPNPSSTTINPSTSTTTSSTIWPASTEQFGTNQTRADQLIGFSTNSSTDTGLTSSSLVAQLKPHFMRYYYGSSVVFDANHPPKGIVSVQDTGISQWWSEEGGLMGISSSGSNAWQYTPQLSFDDFITLCHTNNAEPVVLLPIYAAYPSVSVAHMTKTELYQALVNFVKYANVTMHYQVRYWEIGNEDDIDSPNSTTPQQYAAIFNELVPQLKNASPLFQIQCGANTFWDQTRWAAELPLLKNTMDFAVIHTYTVLGTYPYFLAGQNSHQVEDTQIQVDYFNNAYNSLAANNRPPSNKAIVTEISALDTSTTGTQYELNCTYKGLLNAEVILDTASRGNVFGIMDWCTFYNSSGYGGTPLTSNIFTDSSETALTPTGMSLQVLNEHLYSNLGPKTYSNGKSVEVWISTNSDNTKMSIFMLNKNKSSTPITNFPVPIPGTFAGTSNNEKWVYTGASEYALTMTYGSITTDVTSLSSPTVTLAPLSLTVYDFHPAE